MAQYDEGVYRVSVTKELEKNSITEYDVGGKSIIGWIIEASTRLDKIHVPTENRWVVMSVEAVDFWKWMTKETIQAQAKVLAQSTWLGLKTYLQGTWQECKDIWSTDFSVKEGDWGGFAYSERLGLYVSAVEFPGGKVHFSRDAITWTTLETGKGWWKYVRWNEKKEIFEAVEFPSLRIKEVKV